MDAPEDIANRPSGARDDPDHPGWYSWIDLPADSFAAQTGKMIFRPDGPGRAVVRMFPDRAPPQPRRLARMAAW